MYRRGAKWLQWLQFRGKPARKPMISMHALHAENSRFLRSFKPVL
jgi:hypothetical protein